ncbi:olfactory receptor 18-like [Ochotona curzoniae]|uniref:olfactory receptor 18-like n=1 Tax=Ochotona curzoniae TaxID=130825 RepID=UPI001B354069|nr:olfactory receptor 18-like [Ochotona curzoniae]
MSQTEIVYNFRTTVSAGQLANSIPRSLGALVPGVWQQLPLKSLDNKDSSYTFVQCDLSLYSPVPAFPETNNIFFYTRCPSYADSQNVTRVSEFHLIGLTDSADLRQSLLCGLFFSMYLVTVLGNILIILAVTSDSHLHTPMCFFLCNLSLADVGLTSTTVPKMIVDILTQSTVISYAGCLTQMFVYLLFGCMDDFLLTVMAYDRFVAICHPLHYQVIMNSRRCGFLLLLSIVGSLSNSLLHNLIVLQSSCFKEVEIAHFFCDPSQLLNLTCSETLSKDIVTYIVSIVYGFLSMSGILFSYYKIVSSILRVPSPGGRYKTFSTCGSHLTVVCLFYGAGLGVYLSSSLSLSAGKGALASLVYTVVTPMLNPFIYSLRNKEIKRAMCTLLKKKKQP